MPAACILLLRDLLLEDAATASDAKQALLQLLPLQLEAVEGGGSGMAGGKDKPRMSLITKLGLGSGRQTAGCDGRNCISSGEGSASVRYSNRIALSLMVYLYCCADSAEQVRQVELDLTYKPVGENKGMRRILPCSRSESCTCKVTHILPYERRHTKH